MAREPAAEPVSSGLEALIARLREDGVEAGRAEAARRVAEAETRARRTLEAAEAEARAKLDAARKECEALRRAGEDALRAAARDTVLDLKDQLSRRFADDIAKTVATTLRDEALLQRMILAVAARARDEAHVDDATEIEILLPREAVGLDELRRNPEELRDGSLTQFVAATAGAMLREGVAFGRAEDEAGGLRVRLGDRGVTLDLSDEAVAALILEHLQPRFRALLEGVVK